MNYKSHSFGRSVFFGSALHILIKQIHRMAGLLFPRHCVFCDGVLEKREEGVCISCAERMPCPSAYAFPEGMAVFPYEGAIRASVHRFKYHGRPEYAAYYAECMFRIAGEEIRAFRPDVLLPVPIHASRLRERGYNQAEELAKHLSRRLGIPMDARSLRRVRKTRPQNDLMPEERKRNVRGAFALRRGEYLPEKVLLVDDIYTTGSTVREIRDLLVGNGVREVQTICIATVCDPVTIVLK